MKPLINIVLETNSDAFESWLNEDYVTDDLKKQLENANVLLVPRKDYGDVELKSFPSGTTELFQFLQENSHNDFNVDICIEDSDYRELVLHADEIIIATLVVLPILTNTIATLLSHFIISKLGSKKDNTIVKGKLIVVDKENNKSTELHYEMLGTDFINFAEIVTKSLPSSEKQLTITDGVSKNTVNHEPQRKKKKHRK